MSELIDKGPCEDCGSSDACATYTDGHTHCFSCNTTRQAKGETLESPTPKRSFMDDKTFEGTIRPIKSRGIRVDTCKKYDYRVAKVGGQPIHIANYRRKGLPAAQHIRYADEKDFIWVNGSKRLCMERR